MNPFFFIEYYSAWSLIINLLNYNNIISFNTFVLTIFVFIASNILFWFKPGYYIHIYKSHKYINYKYIYLVLAIGLDIFTHYIPLLMSIKNIPNNIHQWTESLLVFIITFGIYISIYGIKNRIEFYNDCIQQFNIYCID
jgi:uncharacterized membrane protein YidH (DUF202 family)